MHVVEKLEEHKKVLLKYLLLCGLLAGYFGYLSYEYNILTGGMAALLTWSFFVLCTPIADAGFLLDFPLRMLFGVRMVISETVVWTLAISLNIASAVYAPHYYETTFLTRLLHKIITTPYPYWSIHILSLAGTFLSVRFGDGLIDVIRNRPKDFLHSRKFLHGCLMLVVFVLIFVAYYALLASLDISLDAAKQAAP